MDEREFTERADHALERIEAALEACGVDADIERKEGGVLEIEYDDGSRMIVNRHGAAREIWVAARSGGFHFRSDGIAWRDTREGTELFAALSKLVPAQSGETVRLAPSAAGAAGATGSVCACWGWGGNGRGGSGVTPVGRN